MSLNLGNTKIGSLYLGSTKIGQAYLGSVKFYDSGSTPGHVPPFTIRFQFVDDSASFDPTQQAWHYGIDGTWTNVSGSVWDFYYPYTSWWLGAASKKFAIFGGNNSGSSYVPGPLQTVAFNVIDANVTGVDYAPRLFWDCEAMKSVCLFDTSGLKEVGSMFERCASLSYLPNFNFSGVVHENNYSTDFKQFCDMVKLPPQESRKSLLAIPDLTLPSSGSLNFGSMFSSHYYAETGALSLYTKAAALGTSAGKAKAFLKVGYLTTSGAAELAQIPTSWGGGAA